MTCYKLNLKIENTEKFVVIGKQNQLFSFVECKLMHVNLPKHVKLDKNYIECDVNELLEKIKKHIIE